MTDPRDNPDPRHVDEPELWDPQAGAWLPRGERRWSGLAILAALVFGILVGAVLVLALAAISGAYAAPRSGQTTERVDMSAPSSAALSTAPPAPASVVESRSSAPESGTDAGGAQKPTPGPELGTAIEGGIASWYDDGPGLYAAVPTWSFGDRPYRVLVRAGDRSVVVTVRDFCGCPGARIIDLSPAAFAELAPLSVGLVEVTVQDVGAAATPPPTDIERP